MRFACFSGAAAVSDDGDAASDGGAMVVAARHRRSLSFWGKFLSGKGGKGSKEKRMSALKKRGVDAIDDDVYGVATTTASSSVPSSAALSSSASLDSATLLSSRSSSVSSFSGVLSQPAVNKRQATTSPAAGAAAVVLCLLMVVFCGRVGATLLMSTALYLFPRRRPLVSPKEDGVESSECGFVSEKTAKTKVVMKGFMVRNRKK